MLPPLHCSFLGNRLCLWVLSVSPYGCNDAHALFSRQKVILLQEKHQLNPPPPSICTLVYHEVTLAHFTNVPLAQELPTSKENILALERAPSGLPRGVIYVRTELSQANGVMSDSQCAGWLGVTKAAPTIAHKSG